MIIIPQSEIDNWVAENRAQLDRVDGSAGIRLLLKWINLRQKKRIDKYRKEHPAKHDDCVCRRRLTRNHPTPPLP